MTDKTDNSSYVNADNTKQRPDGVYGGVIDQIKKDGVCPFCPERLTTYHKKPIVCETPHWVLTENMYPYDGAKVHLLLIHKEHITSIDDMSAEAWAELKELLAFTKQTYNIPGSTLLFRSGDSRYTGASVSHLHAQLVSSDPTAEGYKPVVARVG